MTPDLAHHITKENLFEHINYNIETGNFLLQLVKQHYQNPHGQLWQGDSLIWLQSIPDNSIDLVFADPPYNIKKAKWDMFQNTHAYIEWSMEWIAEVQRILKPSGTFYICGFSEIVAELVSPCMKHFNSIKWLIWHYKNKANLGNDWGRSHESILHFRKSDEFVFNMDAVRTPYHNHTLKYPEHPQAESSQYSNGGKQHEWTPHPEGSKAKDVIEIPTTCNGMHEKTPHPTQKPEELLRKLILASTNPGDIVLDPFVGSGTTAVCAEQLKRKWLGCDSNEEYLTWAVKRLEQVENKSIEDWIDADKKTQKRRMSIR
jgi:site-specific DNA-methyltransferase (adenine-specific)